MRIKEEKDIRMGEKIMCKVWKGLKTAAVFTSILPQQLVERLRMLYVDYGTGSQTRLPNEMASPKA